MAISNCLFQIFLKCFCYSNESNQKTIRDRSSKVETTLASTICSSDTTSPSRAQEIFNNCGHGKLYTDVSVSTFKLRTCQLTKLAQQKHSTDFVRYLRNWSVSLHEGNRTSYLREFSKFRDFSANRSVLFPSALVTIAKGSSFGAPYGGIGVIDPEI